MTAWPTSLLGEIATRVTKGTTPTTVGGRFTDVGTAFVKVESISGDGQILRDKLAFIDDETNRLLSRSVLQDNDVLFTIAGTIGRVARVTKETLPANTNQAVAIVRPNKNLVDPKFLYYVLRDEIRVQRAQSRIVQSVQANFSLKELSNIEVPLPSMAQQQAIVQVLGALDDKIDLNRRMNETLEAMARALFKDWFVDFGPTRAKMEGREPYLAAELWALFPARLDEEEKPEGWEVRPVGDFADLRGGKQLDKKHILNAGPIPVFGGAGIMGYTTTHNADGYVIAVGRVGAYCGQFFSHRGKAWINNNASLVRPQDAVPAEWLFLSLRHLDIDLIKKGAAQPFVSNSDIANMPICWPGDGVVSAFTESLVPLVMRAEANERESRTLAQTRDLLLPKLMSGEIRVREAERMVEEVV